MKIKDFIKATCFTLMAVMTLVACSDNEEEAPKAEQASLVSFGFYAEDNPGILSKDYVATVPKLTEAATSYEIEIPMPAMVDKSALVARFTVSEGNKTLVDGVKQVSQSTKNNFTAPVDYIVSNSNGTQNLRYTVTITKASNMVWSEAPLIGTATLYSAPVLRINPKDNTPYVAFKVRADEANAEAANKMSVMRLVDGAWARVGALGFSNEVYGSEVDFVISSDGTPYVAYADKEAKMRGAVTAKKFNGSKWETVGDVGFSNTQATYLGLGVFGNELLVTQINSASKNSPFARRTLVVSNYKNGWSTDYLSLFGSGKQVGSSTLKYSGNKAYLYVLTRGDAKYSIFEYENSAWKAIVEDKLQANATHTFLKGANMDVAPDGSLYLINMDDADKNGEYYPRLQRYDAKTKTWETVGGNKLDFGFPYDRHNDVKIAVAPDGTPYVFYTDKNDQNYPKFVYMDAETKQWTKPVTIAKTKASELSAAFTSTGVAYVVFVDDANKLHTFMYAEK